MQADMKRFLCPLPPQSVCGFDELAQILLMYRCSKCGELIQRIGCADPHDEVYIIAHLDSHFRKQKRLEDPQVIAHEKERDVLMVLEDCDEQCPVCGDLLRRNNAMVYDQDIDEWVYLDTECSGRPSRSYKMNMISDPHTLAKSIAQLFIEPIYPSTTVEADIGYINGTKFHRNVGEEYFQSVKLLLESGTSWTSSDEDWRIMVAYKMGGGERISYIDDPHDVQCFSTPVESTASWYCHSGSVNVRLCSRRRAEAAPAPPDSRYTDISIDKFKEFVRKSSAAPGISWVFRLTVRWQGKSLGEAYATRPSYQVNISMKRDQCADGYMASTNEAMQQSLAMNMCGKVKDMLAAGQAHGVDVQLCVL
ncbi:hypothetical protein JKP88DRAFT_241056 [Tribonema minus]|uniref:Uncharacterized protein n=1 Tax=Tribonema minus TaxID=303371 RepID=A0A836CK62_9STRA|nr:hypothetical protein JKP88DRAFT_241056 [Tribonema minus]